MIELTSIRNGDELSLPELPKDTIMVVCNGDIVTVYQTGDELPSQGAGGE